MLWDFFSILIAVMPIWCKVTCKWITACYFLRETLYCMCHIKLMDCWTASNITLLKKVWGSLSSSNIWKTDSTCRSYGLNEYLHIVAFIHSTSWPTKAQIDELSIFPLASWVTFSPIDHLILCNRGTIRWQVTTEKQTMTTKKTFGRTGIRTQDPCEHSNHWATEPQKICNHHRMPFLSCKQSSHWSLQKSWKSVTVNLIS